MEIYNNIIQKSKTQGKSINMIEKEAKLSTGSICKWNTVSPTVKSLKKVADILNCPVDELLDEDDKPKGNRG